MSTEGAGRGRAGDEAWLLAAGQAAVSMAASPEAAVSGGGGRGLAGDVDDCQTATGTSLQTPDLLFI